MIVAILVYVLVGVVVATIFGWDEVNTIFKHWDNNEICKGETQEFLVLMAIYIFGWGIMGIYVVFIDPIKTLLTKNK